MKYIFLLTWFLLTFSPPTMSQAQDQITYKAHNLTSPPTIDGQLNDWKHVTWINDFVDMVNGSKVWLKNKCAFAWDNDNLYMAMKLQEPYLEAKIFIRDDKVYRDPNMELFIAGQNSYWELEVNQVNTIYDVFWIWRDSLAYFPKWQEKTRRTMLLNGIGEHIHPRGERIGFIDANLSGLQVATTKQGTINDFTDQDQGWIVEIAIPWENIALLYEDKNFIPKVGKEIAFNVFRFVNRDKLGMPFPKYRPAGWALFKHGEFDSHMPEKFGKLTLVGSSPQDINLTSLKETLHQSIADTDILALGNELDNTITEHAKLTLEAINNAPWKDKLTPELIENYLLPIRVTQEPLENWRAKFRKELAPLVKNIKEPLEVAYVLRKWINERVLPGASQAWDLSPSALIQAGQGRCEELGILFILMARSVALPSRIAYVPAWRGSDGNHLWVEVWDGNNWQPLSIEQNHAKAGSAWFLHQAEYAPLIIAKAYGKAPSILNKNEEILYSDALSYTINRTAAYANVGQLSLCSTGHVDSILTIYVFNSGRPRAIWIKKGHSLNINLGTGTYLVSAKNGKDMTFSLVQVNHKQKSNITLHIEQNQGIVGLEESYKTIKLREIERQGFVPLNRVYLPTQSAQEQKNRPQSDDALLNKLPSSDRYYVNKTELMHEQELAGRAWQALHGHMPTGAEEKEVFEKYVQNFRVTRENFSHWYMELKHKLIAKNRAKDTQEAIKIALDWTNSLKNLPLKGKDPMTKARLSIKNIVQSGFVSSPYERLWATVASLRAQGLPARLSYEKDIFGEDINPFVEVWNNSWNKINNDPS